jgi:hypothetical protein
MQCLVRFTCAAMALRAAGIADAATWAVPGTTGNWNTTGNWLPAAVPANVAVTVDGEDASASAAIVDATGWIHSLSVNTGDTVAFTLGTNTATLPAGSVFGDLTLAGTVSVAVAAGFDGQPTSRYDVITATGTITDRGFALVSADPDHHFWLIDDGTRDGSVTIGLQPIAGSVFSLR